jgi:small GTP-binding protein
MERRGDILAKILILGNSQVGKSSILNQFTDGIFSETIGPTLGIDYKINKVTIDGVEIKLQIWDTAGQERFRSITENFYKGAHGIILAFDLTDKESFSTIRNWLKNIYEKAGSNVIVCLLGNKLDLVNKAEANQDFSIDREKFVSEE